MVGQGAALPGPERQNPPASDSHTDILEEMKILFPALVGPGGLIQSVTKQLNLLGKRAPTMKEPAIRYFLGCLTETMMESLREAIVDIQGKPNFLLLETGRFTFPDK